ncbi:MAG: general secretion pathway protein GspK [Xanthomonadales bacterium]|nr:general secretion pathway protein GspK [Xanthomonadales bacterium]
MRTRQSGIAFLLVLWLLALLAIVLGAFALLARSERLMARQTFEGAKARYAAEAGISQAVYALSWPDPAQRWMPDGRVYTFQFDDAEIEIEITDETGKLDLNQADQEILTRFFEVHGLETVDASALAAAVIDFRDPDDLITPGGAEDDDYEAAGLPYGAKDAPFDLVSEVQQVLGMSYALYQEIEPSLTVWSMQARPNPAFAPVDVLQAMPGMDALLAQQALAMRLAYDPTSGLMPDVLPDGSPLVTVGGSGTYTVQSRARLPNGAWAALDTTIRMAAVPLSGSAYTVLRWQDGSFN